MVWRIEFSPLAERNLPQLDRQVGQRILKFLHDRVAQLDNPRMIGEAQKGSKLGEFWKYRVGDYRIIANIDNEAVRVIVVRQGNRREIYR